MKKIAILPFAAIFAFAQGELQYEKNLSIGNSGEPNYTIVQYDCLWDLAEKYYGDPFEWRYIWQHNPYIEDPHWIYPGDMLFIPGLPSSGTPSSQIPLYDTSKTLSQLNSQIKKFSTQEQSALLEKYRYFISAEAQRQTPFVYEAQHKSGKNKKSVMYNYGEVVNQERPLLVQNKDAFVKITLAKSEADKLVKIGTELCFYAIRYDLKSRRGIIIEPVGAATVRSVDRDFTTVYIDKAWGRISKGAVVAPFRELKSVGVRLTYKSYQDTFETQTVARLNPDSPVKPFETVFIDKGEQEGTVIGDHFVFYEKARRGSSKKHEELPIFEGLVVAAEKNTATLKVVSVRDVAVSDMFYGVRQGRIVSRD